MKLKLLLCSAAFAAWSTGVSAQTCATAPTCSELGFTSSVASCVGSDMVKCPFDKTKVFCRQTKSCAELGFNKTTTQCSGKKTFVCPADSSKVACDDSAMIGEIKLWAGKTIPKGWLKCDGTSKSKTTYAKLYDVIGTSFGSSGSYFYLPNFNGRVAVGAGTSSSGGSYNYEFGKTGGQNYVTLDKTEIPDHKHPIPWGENQSYTNKASPPWGYYNQFGLWGNSGGMSKDGSRWYSGYMTDRYYVRSNATSTSGSTTTNTTKYSDIRTYSASTGAHDNKMPFSVVYYIIYAGVY